MLLYDSLNLVINALSSGLLEGAWFRRKEVESAAAVGLCCTHTLMHVHSMAMAFTVYIVHERN